MTILVSSHILEELYQTATEFILIDKGKIIEEISDQELNERCKSRGCFVGCAYPRYRAFCIQRYTGRLLFKQDRRFRK